MKIILNEDLSAKFKLICESEYRTEEMQLEYMMDRLYPVKIEKIPINIKRENGKKSGYMKTSSVPYILLKSLYIVTDKNPISLDTLVKKGKNLFFTIKEKLTQERCKSAIGNLCKSQLVIPIEEDNMVYYAISSKGRDKIIETGSKL